MQKIEEFKNLSWDRKNPPSIEEMAEYTAHGLVQLAWHSAFKLFRDKKFRKLVDFENLGQVEQDRIFNELTVTAILLIMFILEAPDLRVPPEFKDYLQYLKDEIPKAHLERFKELGIERKYRRLWRKLLGMRYEEYQKDKHKIRAAAMELHSREAPLSTESLSEIQLTLPVETLAIGALFHIRRGKARPEDPLFKMLLKWLGELYLQVRVTAEGGKITWWKKIKAKLRIGGIAFKVVALNPKGLERL